MQHKVKVTVIDKKCFTDYQEEYLADKQSGPCPFYHVGDEFVFERYDGVDDFWREGNGSQCAEAWDCISRYIYTGLQGGSIMRGWTKDERMMMEGELDEKQVKLQLESMSGVRQVEVIGKRGFAEIYLEDHVPEKSKEEFKQAVKTLRNCKITGVE